MNGSERPMVVQVDLPPAVAVAMRMIGLEGDDLAREMRKATAIDLYAARLLSIGKAAELAGLDLADFMDLLVSRGMAVAEYSPEDLDQDLTAFAELVQ
jgi:predicted HTH domain antitoxin